MLSAALSLIQDFPLFLVFNRIPLPPAAQASSYNHSNQMNMKHYDLIPVEYCLQSTEIDVSRYFADMCYIDLQDFWHLHRTQLMEGLQCKHRTI